jgi:hypothetical protein
MNRLSLLAMLLWLIVAQAASAGFVIPQMGGGQEGQGTAPMKHADITFDGTDLAVHVDNTIDTPMLRSLVEPNEFDPTQPWSVLNYKAYNFQYGWNPGGFISLPSGSWIWIEQLSATPGLEVYQRPPATPAYAPIFGTSGSPLRWRWSGAMTHNVYAVVPAELDKYEANYRVYLGDNTTGEPLPAYGSTDVTFHFLASPVLPGDYNDDGVVDAADYTVWREGLGTVYTVNYYDTWRANFGRTSSDSSNSATNAVPEPFAAFVPIALAAAACWRQRRYAPVMSGCCADS